MRLMGPEKKKNQQIERGVLGNSPSSYYLIPQLGLFHPILSFGVLFFFFKEGREKLEARKGITFCEGLKGV